MQPELNPSAPYNWKCKYVSLLTWGNLYSLPCSVYLIESYLQITYVSLLTWVCLFLITYFIIELFLLFFLSGVDKVIDAAYLDSAALFMCLSYWNRCICMGLKLHLGRMNMGKNYFFLVVRYDNALQLLYKICLAGDRK
jgi:hypothetical protein